MVIPQINNDIERRTRKSVRKNSNFVSTSHNFQNEINIETYFENDDNYMKNREKEH